MPTTITEFWWTILIGTGVFFSLGVGIIAFILRSQRRILKMQEENYTVLQESEERFRTLVEGTPVPTLVAVRGSIMYVNRAVLDIFKTSLANDVLGKSFLELVQCYSSSSVDAKQVEHILSQHLRLPATECILRCCNGELLDAEISTIPLLYNGTQALLIVLHDLSKTKEAESILREIPKKIIAAQEAERRRFSRELHDGVNQILFNVKGKVELLEKKSDPLSANGGTNFSSILEPLKIAMKEIQWISRNLRPSALDDLGLGPAIGSMSDEFTFRTHIRVMVSGLPEKRLDPDAELAFFRITQEALNNVEKHSMATQVLIECMEDESFFRLVISDNGKGIQPDPLGALRRSQGIGLTTMRERAELIGGTLTYDSEPGKGTRITVVVPAEQLIVPK